MPDPLFSSWNQFRNQLKQIDSLMPDALFSSWKCNPEQTEESSFSRPPTNLGGIVRDRRPYPWQRLSRTIPPRLLDFAKKRHWRIEIIGSGIKESIYFNWFQNWFLLENNGSGIKESIYLNWFQNWFLLENTGSGIKESIYFNLEPI